MRTDRDVAVAAVEAGARVLRAMYGSPGEHHAKTSTDFATAADLASERAIQDVIAQACPEDAFVGEELGASGASRASRTWLVDPLCGTLNFAAATPLFSVNVALSVAGTTRVAAVAHPPSGEIYWADATAFGVLGRDRSYEAPRTRIVDINADGPLDRPFVGAQLAADAQFRRRYSPRIESTTLALAWVATGNRLGYVTDGLHRDSVHFAAGIALCQSTGVRITDFDGNAVHSGPGIVAAADDETHESLLRLIARYR